MVYIMLDKMMATISEYNMLSPGERVCVGLSGGADSVSLLLALSELGYDVFAVHVNHNLRGEESLSDQKFCEKLCDRLWIRLFVESVDVKGYCEANKCSCEEGARKLRYSAIEKHLDKAKLATAHNLNDCFETSLFYLVRGCGLNGLCGIPPVRDNIIRPLIAVTRAEIEEYLKSKGQDFVTDSTNLSDDCSRNIIRLNVIPQLERINPSLFKTYSFSLANFEEANEYITSSARELILSARTENGYDLGKRSALPVLKTAIRIMLSENGVEPSFDRINAVLELIDNDSRINIQKGVYLRSKSGRISFETDFDDIFIPHPLKGKAAFGAKEIKFTEISQFDISSYNKKELKWIIDLKNLNGQTVLRSYKGNEKIKLFGKDFSQEVKKLLSKTPSQLRKTKLVISDDMGAVFVEGCGVAERAACSDKTSAAVKIEIN